MVTDEPESVVEAQPDSDTVDEAKVDLPNEIAEAPVVEASAEAVANETVTPDEIEEQPLVADLFDADTTSDSVEEKVAKVEGATHADIATSNSEQEKTVIVIKRASHPMATPKTIEQDFAKLSIKAIGNEQRPELLVSGRTAIMAAVKSKASTPMATPASVE